MIKNIFTSISLLFVIFNSGFAQRTEEENKKENFFYIGPADLFFNTLQLDYEKKLKSSNTIALSGGFKLSEKDGAINREGINGEVQYRINLLYNKEGLSKIVRNYSAFAYFAPYLQYRYEELRDKMYFISEQPVNNLSTVNSYFGGVGFGCRFSALENRFTLNIFAGGGLKYANLTGNRVYSDFLDIGYTGIAPKVEFQMGIAF